MRGEPGSGDGGSLRWLTEAFAAVRTFAPLHTFAAVHTFTPLSTHLPNTPSARTLYSRLQVRQKEARHESLDFKMEKLQRQLDALISESRNELECAHLTLHHNLVLSTPLTTPLTTTTPKSNNIRVLYIIIMWLELLLY